MKKAFWLMVIVAGIALVANACGKGGGSTADLPVADVTDGLVARYAFNGNANDLVSAVNGTTVGGVAYTADRFGTANSACSFNGTDAGIDIAGPISMNTNTFVTVSMWVKATDAGYDTYFITSSLFGFWYNGTFSKIQFVAGTNEPNFAEADLSLNTWTHVVGTYDNATLAINIYVNGVFVRSELKPSPIVGTMDVSTLHLGYMAVPTDYWAGEIDDFRVYNRVLSAAEIAQLYQYHN